MVLFLFGWVIFYWWLIFLNFRVIFCKIRINLKLGDVYDLGFLVIFKLGLVIVFLEKDIMNRV